MNTHRTGMNKLIDKSIVIKNNLKYSLIDRWNLYKARQRCINWIFKQDSNGVIKRYEPLVSILLPTRNRWDILKERALPSVLNQTYKNWELIIIDDDSNKTLWNVLIRKFSNIMFEERISYLRISPKKYHYPKTALNRWCAGPVKALNYGLQQVKGDWIARLDDDDEWHPDMLQSMLDFARDGNYEFVSAGWEDVKGMPSTNYHYGNYEIGGVQTWLYRSYLKCFKYNPDCWRKSCDKVNDVDLQFRMFKAGVRFGFLNKVVCTIRPRPGQNSIGLQAQLKEYENNVEA